MLPVACCLVEIHEKFTVVSLKFYIFFRYYQEECTITYFILTKVGLRVSSYPTRRGEFFQFEIHSMNYDAFDPMTAALHGAKLQ
jgi:hypothetical protein